MMGSPESEAGRSYDEKQHEVTISKDFYMGKYEVTQEQYEAVMGVNPAYFTKEKEGGPKHPVETVSWDDPVNTAEGTRRALRGGAWNTAPFRVPAQQHS